jgi:shikimate dehydrogenase
VVDTIVRHPAGTIGYNTNVWAARTALEILAGGAAPRSLLVVGAGASAHSAALAARRLWPTCRILITARSAEAAATLAAQVEGTPVGSVVDPVEVVVHATAWGETSESESQPFPLELGPWLRPAIGFFDLNNRIGALQHQALDAGCRVMSGALMQRVTHACRAALTSLAVSEVAT